MFTTFFPGPDVAAVGCLQYCASGPRGTHLQPSEQPAEISNCCYQSLLYHHQQYLKYPQVPGAYDEMVAWPPSNLET